MADSLAEKLFVIPKTEIARTFEHDDSLPSLPVPTLEHTLERYLDSVKPFLTEEEMANTRAIVSEFQKGIGQKLHARLLRRAKRERNWLERWWEDVVYLTNRQPLLPYTSMAGITNNAGWGTNQIKNAALLSYHVCNLWQLIRQQRLRPDYSRVEKKHFSMYGFKRLFNCVRVPGEEHDTLAMYFKTASEGTCPSHVIVLCEGHIFSVNALNEKGQLLTPPEWERHFLFIKEISKKGRGQCLSVLTCTDRTTWAKNRLHLERLSVDNRVALNTIDTAIFVLTLDSSVAPTVTDITQQLLCGDMTNRWTDKSLASIVFQNGVDGALSEHCAYDGMISIGAMSYVNIRYIESDWVWKGSQTVGSLPDPEEIIMLTDRHIEEEVKKALSETAAHRSNVLFLTGRYHGFGKDLIRSFKIHPDSFSQIAIQLAYYRMHGRPAPTYETATTREFYHGRTETLRTCTPETVEFVKAMLSPNSTTVIRRELLKTAAGKLQQLMKEAKANEGCDRHLLGLYCLAVEHNGPVPAIFTDPAFVKSGGNGNFILSTSLVGYTQLGGCVAPMCKDGYGCFYNICPDCIYFTISVFRDSHETSSYKLSEALRKSFDDMKSVMQDVPAAKL